MLLNDLKNGQQVTARIGRAGTTNVKWEPWATHTLYVQRGKKGDVAILTVKLVKRDWAEYGPADFQPKYGLFEIEGYYLEIEGVRV